MEGVSNDRMNQWQREGRAVQPRGELIQIPGAERISGLTRSNVGLGSLGAGEVSGEALAGAEVQGDLPDRVVVQPDPVRVPRR